MCTLEQSGSGASTGKTACSMLHEGHPGISRMKSLARGIVWWPKLDADQETLVRSCKACQENQKCCLKVQLHPWEWPAEPWLGCMLISLTPFWESNSLSL